MCTGPSEKKKEKVVEPGTVVATPRTAQPRGLTGNLPAPPDPFATFGPRIVPLRGIGITNSRTSVFDLKIKRG